MNVWALNKCIKFTMWGDTGRLPIAVTCIKQAFTYIKRLESLKNNNQPLGNLGRKCICRTRKSLTALSKRLRELQEKLGMHRSLNAVKALRNIENKFKRLWNSAMPLNSKFYFYNIVKSEITFEPYLEINEYERRRALAQ